MYVDDSKSAKVSFLQPLETFTGYQLMDPLLDSGSLVGLSTLFAGQHAMVVRHENRYGEVPQRWFPNRMASHEAVSGIPWYCGQVFLCHVSCFPVNKAVFHPLNLKTALPMPLVMRSFVQLWCSFNSVESLIKWNRWNLVHYCGITFISPLDPVWVHPLGLHLCRSYLLHDATPLHQVPSAMVKFGP